jgi:sterol desaturase/sphingolipid hydroxylase (fatty acid hydroxylase superfamily)
MIDPIVYALPVFLVLIVAEIIISIKHEEHLYEVKDFKSSLYLAFGASVITSATKVFILGLFYFLYESFKEFRMQIFGYESLGWAWWVWLLAFVGDDFNFYWYHRLSHSIRFLWAAHVVHHSSKYFNLGSGIRNGWTTMFYKPLFWLWMPLLGFHPLMVATAISINSIYQFFLHSKKVPYLGFIEHIFNTPKLHQVHHSSDMQYLDKNHGGILIIWDKLFGTFEREPDTDSLTFGLPKGPDSYNPFKVVFYEYNNIWNDIKKVTAWKTKLKYVFYAPGWSHDGSTKTAKQLQAGLKNKEYRSATQRITQQQEVNGQE